ncbi:hypothetical protein [Chloroherpeton thalassium]|uniref:hypothetical protein n=1 Tax=Chloroherpeton thalassium TaxID=100716 RepID=UPI0002D74192|nr:hypothetical protein [Chloroherpeton thalassium]
MNEAEKNKIKERKKDYATFERGTLPISKMKIPMPPVKAPKKEITVKAEDKNQASD